MDSMVSLGGRTSRIFWPWKDLGRAVRGKKTSSPEDQPKMAGKLASWNLFGVKNPKFTSIVISYFMYIYIYHIVYMIILHIYI